MTNIATPLLLGLAGALVLKCIFYSIKLEWPASYSTAEHVVQSRIKQNWALYSAFRLVPYVIVAYLTANIAATLGASAIVAIWTLLVAHVATTNAAPPVLQQIRYAGKGNRRGQLLLIVGATVGMVAISLLVAFTWAGFAPLVPDPEGLLQSAWAALIIGVGAILIRAVSKFNREADFNTTPVALRQENLDAVFKASAEYDVSPRFILSVLATEVANRPRWLRKIENILGRLYGRGTYGIAQIPSRGPITDEESIYGLCKRHASFWPAPTNYGTAAETVLVAEIEKHNPASAFVTETLSRFRAFVSDDFSSSEARDRNLIPLMWVRSITRHGVVVTVELCCHRDLEQLSFRGRNRLNSSNVAVRTCLSSQPASLPTYRIVNLALDISLCSALVCSATYMDGDDIGYPLSWQVSQNPINIELKLDLDWRTIPSADYPRRG